MKNILKDKQFKKAIKLTLPFLLVHLTFIVTMPGSFFTLFYRQQIHMTQAQVMTIQSYYLIMDLIFQIPTGLLSDKIGYKKSMILGHLLLAVAYISYPFTHSFIQVLIPETVFGLATALYSTSSSSLIYEILKRNNIVHKYNDIKQLKENLFRISTVGSAIFVFKVAQLVTPAQALAINAIPEILSIIIFLSFKQGNEIKPKHKTNNTSFKTYLIDIKTAIASLNDKILRKYVILDLTISSILYSMSWLISNQIINIEIPSQYFGGIVSIQGLLTLPILIYLTKRISDKDKAYRIHKSLYFILIFIGLLLSSSTTGIIILFSLILKDIPSTLFNMYYPTIEQSKISSDLRSTTLSGIALLKSLVFAIISPIIGYMFDWNMQATALILTVLILIIYILAKDVDLSPLYKYSKKQA